MDWLLVSWIWLLVSWIWLLAARSSSYSLLQKQDTSEKQPLELGMKHQTGSNLGKKYVKAVYCHPAYLTSIQSIS